MEFVNATFSGSNPKSKAQATHLRMGSEAAPAKVTAVAGIVTATVLKVCVFTNV